MTAPQPCHSAFSHGATHQLLRPVLPAGGHWVQTTEQCAHLAKALLCLWAGPGLCRPHSRLWGGTNRSRVFWGRLAQTEAISFLSSASHWCCFVPAGVAQGGRGEQC